MLQRVSSEPQAWAWVACVPNPPKPLSPCPWNLGIWVLAPITKSPPFTQPPPRWKGLDFPPKDPLGFPDTPSSGARALELALAWLARTAGGQLVALPFLCGPASLGPAPTGREWQGLGDKAPTQQSPGPPEAAAWGICTSEPWGGDVFKSFQRATPGPITARPLSTEHRHQYFGKLPRPL